VELLSYQHNTIAAQSFYWFVDDGVTRTWIGRNFDIDIGTNLCDNVPCELTYIAPSGNSFPATLSGNQLWNPGQPDRGPGDLFTDAEAGLWRVDILMPVNNQYIIEIENNSKPIFLDQPILPDVIIAKDDGVTLVQSPGVTTYTIVATNTGKGPALSVLGPEVVDTLPIGMGFAGCAVNPPLEGTCTESAPGSGVINFELNPQSLALNSDGSPFGPILAYLPGVSSGLTNTGSLQVSANIAPGLADGTLLTNTVTIDWTDTYNNDYPTRSDDDIDIVQASAATPTPSITPTPTATSTSTPLPTPTDDGGDDPTSTPERSTPVGPTPVPGTPSAGIVVDPGAAAPVLPVSFLPETGMHAVTQPHITAGQISLMLALGGFSAAMFCLWLRSRQKD
jgi:uncharacterized repeat protein (TIGR01451 family)